MTDAVALSMPTNARAGNAGRAPAGRMGADAAGQDQDGGGLSGFEAMFASIESGEPPAEGQGAVARGQGSPMDGDVAVTAPPGSGADPSSTAKIPMIPGGVASAAALALMRLNEAAMPSATLTDGNVPAEAAQEALEMADGEGEALLAASDIAETEADVALSDQQPSQSALQPWSVPVVPMPLPAVTPATAAACGNSPADGDRSGAEAVASELLARFDTAPEPPSGRSLPPGNENATTTLMPDGSSASAVNRANSALVRASGEAVASAGQAITTPSVKAGQYRNTRPGEQAAANDTDASASDGTATAQVVSASGQPQAAPPTRSPFTASNPTGQTIGQASSASQSAGTAPATATDEDPAQALASNLTSRAQAASGEDFELAREPAALTGARIAAVHQETYFAPAVLQSPAEQIAERLTEELVAPSAQAAVASSDQAQDGAAQAVKVLHLQLNPPDLGPVTLRMTLKHEALDLQVEVSNRKPPSSSTTTAKSCSGCCARPVIASMRSRCKPHRAPTRRP